MIGEIYLMKKEEKNKRINVSVRLTNDEHEQLKKLVNEAGFSTINSYIRKMSLNGYIIKLDLTSILEPIKLMRNISSNMNQIATRINSTNNIYADDIVELKENYEHLSKSISEIISYFRKLEE